MKKTAMITGASRGIGRAIAAEYAKAGYDLILLCHKNEEMLVQLKESLVSKHGIECTAYVGDLADGAFTESVFSNVASLDILVNNAGISYMGLLSQMTLEEWNRVLSVNLTSAFLCSKYAIPLMLSSHRGKIINISSVWGNVGASMEVAYSASKGGLNSFTKALAKELAPSHIQVNAIACGAMDTEMNHCYSPEEINALVAEIPADRLGRPEEAALLALQLAEGCEYMTGQIISLDGGWL